MALVRSRVVVLCLGSTTGPEMHRNNLRTSADRIGTGMLRAMIDKVQDNSLLQSLNLLGRGPEKFSDVEHMHPFGMRTFPQDRTSDQDAQGGAPKGGPELLLTSMMGNASHQMALPAIDRRFGPMNLAKGETVFHDAFKQFLHFAQGAMKGESPKRIVHQVASPKQQGGGQDGGQGAGSGSSSGSQQQNSGRADLTAEKQVHVSVAMDKDGSYAVSAEGAATITAKSITFKAEGCSITMSGGKIVLKGEIHLGDEGGQRVGMIGTLDTKGDALVESGAATKVYAI